MEIPLYRRNKSVNGDSLLTLFDRNKGLSLLVKPLEVSTSEQCPGSLVVWQ